MKIYDYNGKKNISAERIALARRRIKMSQTILATQMQVEGVNIERNSISRIEAGTRFVADYEIAVMSKILNVSTDWLLGIEK